MSSIAARRVTARGFDVYDEFADSYGNWVRVQRSSAAILYDGDLNAVEDSWVWIFSEREGASNPPHLSIAQARRLRDALNTFIRENK